MSRPVVEDVEDEEEEEEDIVVKSGRPLIAARIRAIIEQQQQGGSPQVPVAVSFDFSVPARMADTFETHQEQFKEAFDEAFREKWAEMYKCVSINGSFWLKVRLVTSARMVGHGELFAAPRLSLSLIALSATNDSFGRSFFSIALSVSPIAFSVLLIGLFLMAFAFLVPSFFFFKKSCLSYK